MKRKRKSWEIFPGDIVTYDRNIGFFSNCQVFVVIAVNKNQDLHAWYDCTIVTVERGLIVVPSEMLMLV